MIMKYAYEIISLIGWPVLIFVAYKLSMMMINRFEKGLETGEQTETNTEEKE